ncbi:MAG: SRPBCC domain-containing protein [Candidatus Hermodarchaeota archaeon]
MQNIIQIDIELNCGISEAFEMFTVSKKLESWLPEKAEVEPKVGGKYELFWNPKSRDTNSTIGCKITSIERNKFLSFEWKGPEMFQSFMNFCDPLTHVVVVFTPSVDDPRKSLVYLFHTGWRDDPVWEEARSYFEKAWLRALTNLKEKISSDSMRSNTN